ncbi:MAG: VWA domain-containing protein [Thermoleophilia bacterium]
MIAAAFAAAALGAAGAPGEASAVMKVRSAATVSADKSLTVTVTGARTSPCRLRLTAPREQPRFTVRRTFSKRVSVPLPLGAPAGKWTVRVRCGPTNAVRTVRVVEPVFVAGDTTTADFRVALVPIPRPSASVRTVRLDVGNLRPWTATSVRACVRIETKGARITHVYNDGSRKSAKAACWIYRSFPGGAQARGTLRVAMPKKARPGAKLAISAFVSAGNSNPTRVRLAAAPAKAAKRTRRQNQTPSCVVPRRLGVAFVVDDSGSMSANDPSDLRAQAVAVGLDQLPDGSLAGATEFADSTGELFEVSEVNGSTRPGLKDAASYLFSSGGTDFDEAFLGAQLQLAAMGSADRKAVIFLSDGAPGNINFTSDRDIAAAGTPIYTISLGSADRQIMEGIASRSGGSAYDATSAGDLQSIFARIVSSLTCDSRVVDRVVTIAPGQTIGVPFQVGADDGEFRALATWSSGSVTATASRPDGSVLTGGALRGGEGLTQAETYALVTGANPPAGNWVLNLTADASNTSPIDVTIDVFKRTIAATPPPPQTGPGPRAVDIRIDGRTFDPCVSAYSETARSQTTRITGGTRTVYNRSASLEAVCGGFGAPEDLNLSPGMRCALIAAGAVFVGPSGRSVDWLCTAENWSGVALDRDWRGPAANQACGFFGEIFAGGVGIFAAGATAASGPGAAAVGLAAYRAMAAFMKVGCGGLFDGGARALGVKLEADHERNIARDIERSYVCLARQTRFGITSWSATQCP